MHWKAINLIENSSHTDPFSKPENIFMYSRAPISFKIQKFRRAHINFFIKYIKWWITLYRISDGGGEKISIERRFPLSSDP